MYLLIPYYCQLIPAKRKQVICREVVNLYSPAFVFIVKVVSGFEQ